MAKALLAFFLHAAVSVRRIQTPDNTAAETIGEVAATATAAAEAGAAVECDETFESAASYRGCQSRTRSGRTCQSWSSQKPHVHSFTPDNQTYAGQGLSDNFCRSPGNYVPEIWCYTTDPNRRWEYCDPLPTPPPPPGLWTFSGEEGTTRQGRSCTARCEELGGVCNEDAMAALTNTSFEEEVSELLNLPCLSVRSSGNAYAPMINNEFRYRQKYGHVVTDVRCWMPTTSTSCSSIPASGGATSRGFWDRLCRCESCTKAIPGNWLIKGSGCETDGNCVQSNNYPSPYGAYETCDIELFDVPLRVDGTFATGGDSLYVNGVAYRGENPSNLASLDGVRTGVISWSSDYQSPNWPNTGWRLCRTD